MRTGTVVVLKWSVYIRKSFFDLERFQNDQD